MEIVCSPFGQADKDASQISAEIILQNGHIGECNRVQFVCRFFFAGYLTKISLFCLFFLCVFNFDIGLCYCTKRNGQQSEIHTIQ